MKIRTGFVSNSSSSSFLVGLKQKPKTRGELRDLMFGELEGDVIVYDYSLSIDGIVCRVFKDLEGKTPITKKEILEEINSGYFPGCPEYSNRDNEESRKIRKEFADKTGVDLWNDDAKKHDIHSEYEKMYRVAQEKEYEIEKKKRLEAANRYYDSVKHRFKDLKVFKLEYADDGGETVLEHGDVFNRIPHVIISHH